MTATSFIARAANLFAAFRRCDRGVTAIEFVFVAPIAFAILLVTLQTAVIFIAQSYLDNLAEEAMRLVLTNRAYSLTQTQFKSAVCANAPALFNCGNLIVQLEPVNCGSSQSAVQCVNSLAPQFKSDGSLASTPSFVVGSQNSQMLLMLMYEWPVISGPLGVKFTSQGMPNGTFLLVSTQVFYKEPCLASSGCVQTTPTSG
jgi:Flp pilus assembly protein TadG